MSDTDTAKALELLRQGTPGPWRAGPPAWFRGRQNPADGKRPITSANPGHQTIANVYGEANARRIAANPLLVEVAAAAVKWRETRLASDGDALDAALSNLTRGVLGDG